MPKLLKTPVVRETAAIVRRHARDLPRPLVIELDPRCITLRPKGTHEGFTLSLQRLFELAQRDREEPLTVYAEEQQLTGCCRG